MHPFLKIAKYGRWWAIKTISLEGVIWIDVQISQEALLREIRPKKNQKMIIWLCQKILIKIWSKRGGPPPPPPHPTPRKKYQICILCQNSLTKELKIRVVGMVLKQLLTYFEMLIGPHVLHSVDGCFFVFYRIWHFPSGILNSDLNSLAKFTY